MDRVAVFVDAGYLFAAGSKLIAGEKLARGELSLDRELVVEALSKIAGELSGLPLLRLYWYDGTSAGPTPQQLALAYHPNVKLRLGFVNPQGQQKGVDSLIVTDLIELARNRAMADAVLLTGDEDIRVGVQQAQEFGVRVHLLGIAPAKENQSGFLVQEADSVRELSQDEVQKCLKRVVPPAALAPEVASVAPGEGPGILEKIAHAVAEQLLPAEREAVVRSASGGMVPREIDGKLLSAGGKAIQGVLSPQQKRLLRQAFLDACRAASAH